LLLAAGLAIAVVFKRSEGLNQHVSPRARLQGASLFFRRVDRSEFDGEDTEVHGFIRVTFRRLRHGHVEGEGTQLAPVARPLYRVQGIGRRFDGSELETVFPWKHVTGKERPIGPDIEIVSPCCRDVLTPSLEVLI